MAECDVLVDLARSRTPLPDHAYALVKRTYTIEPDGLHPAEAIPLAGDFRASPDRMVVGSDFWTDKAMTDVVVLGSAFAPRGSSVHRSEVRCTVGHRTKRVAVFGKRVIEWSPAGRPRLGAPERFTEIPMTLDRAYGGVDSRVPYAPITSVVEALSQVADHPGSYPRNPEGRGYYVLPQRFDGIELPSLEDPDDLLTDERLVVGAAQHWHRQPLPWSLDWLPPYVFPRMAFVGADARYPVSSEALAEVTRGFLPLEYRHLGSIGRDADRSGAASAFRRRFYQEASLGMCFDDLTPGCPISISGMHPEGREIHFALPNPPVVEIVCAKIATRVLPKMTTVVVRPAARTATVTYHARTKDLPRDYLPGLQTRIPLAVRIDGGQAVPYAPSTPFPALR